MTSVSPAGEEFQVRLHNHKSGKRIQYFPSLRGHGLVAWQIAPKGWGGGGGWRRLHSTLNPCRRELWTNTELWNCRRVSGKLDQHYDFWRLKLYVKSAAGATIVFHYFVCHAVHPHGSETGPILTRSSTFSSFNTRRASNPFTIIILVLDYSLVDILQGKGHIIVKTTKSYNTVNYVFNEPPDYAGISCLRIFNSKGNFLGFLND